MTTPLPAPKVDSDWWKKFEDTRHLKSPQVKQALSVYQEAARQHDYHAMAAALSQVHTAAKALYDHEHQSMAQGELVNFLKAVKHAWEEAEKQAKASAPKQTISGPVRLWEIDMGDEVEKKYPNSWLEIKGYTVTLMVNGDIRELLEKEKAHAVAQTMVDDSHVLCDRAIAHILAVLHNFDPAKSGNPSLEGAKLAEHEAEKEIRATVTKLAAEVAKVPQVRWNHFLEQHAQYHSYQLKVAGDFVLGTLSLGAVVTGVVLAIPTGGASLALGIVATARGTAGLLTNCVDFCRDAEAVHQSLNEDLKALIGAYRGAFSGAVGAAEMTSTVLKSILGTHLPFLKTLSKCNSDYKLLQGKVAELAMNQNQVSKRTLTLLEQIEQLEKLLAHARSAEAHNIHEMVVRLQKTVHSGLDKTSELGASVSKAEKAMPAIEEMLKELNSTNPKYAEIFDKMLPALTNAGLGLGGFGTGIASATSAIEFGQAAVSLGTDIVKMINDARAN
jgi:hypothetical protein